MAKPSPREAELAAKRQHWKQHLSDWAESGLTQVDYCRQHNLSRHRFQYWKKKYHRSQSASLIELHWPPGQGSSHQPLRLMVGRYEVAVDRDFDPVALRQLIAVLSRL